MEARPTALPVIEFDNFSFKYDAQAKPTLYNLSFAIYPGEKVLILGPSGSGKSTLGQCLNGQIPNTFPGTMEGDIRIQGHSIKNASIFDLSLEVGSVLQDTDHQFVGLTVAEDLAFSLENDQVTQGEMKARVTNWAKDLGLEKLLNLAPHDLSGGQKQRVSLAGVLINQVPILLFDEPLANLDPKTGRETMELINQISHKHGLTSLIIEHRLEECLVADIDRVLVIDQGRLAFNGSMNDLLHSDLLDQVGLRKPLYLKALEYAQVNLPTIPYLGDYQAIKLPDQILESVEDWVMALEHNQLKQDAVDILTINQLSFAYKDRTEKQLEDISFKIKKGQMVGIVGTNGAGKSTLAKLICGFLRPQSGQIMLDNQDLKAWSIKEIADSIGFVLQNPNQMISNHFIKDEVGLGLVYRGWSPDKIETRVNQVLDICGLFPFRNWPISALSYGQKRRVTIASILALNPQVIILDEPTAGQDYRTQTKMMAFLQELNQDHGITIIMISHDMHLIQEYAQRCLVFDQGHLVADLVPSDLFNRPALLDQAHLVPTSLYLLGQDLPHLSAQKFIDSFIAYERGLDHG